MSNVTDGKTALKAGKFQTAEKKFLRALATHPDDGEIWWALMLCRAECRDDNELKSALVKSFTQAAKSGAPQPDSPLDTPYGVNALRYAEGERGSKRRAFVDALNAELDGIWKAERGGSIKRREVKTLTPRKKISPRAVTAYVCAALALVFCGLSAYGCAAGKTWLTWTGFGLFAAAEAVTAWLIISAKRAGGRIRAAMPIAVAVGVVAGIAMFTAAFVMNDRALLIAAAIVICIAAAIAAFMLIPDKRGKRSGKGERSPDKPTRKTEKPRAPKPHADFTDDFD